VSSEVELKQWVFVDIASRRLHPMLLEHTLLALNCDWGCLSFDPRSVWQMSSRGLLSEQEVSADSHDKEFELSGLICMKVRKEFAKQHGHSNLGHSTGCDIRMYIGCGLKECPHPMRR
jgi:hypothetical protein